ncbi:unnamed protein product [Arctogadus glacialis]
MDYHLGGPVDYHLLGPMDYHLGLQALLGPLDYNLSLGLQALPGPQGPPEALRPVFVRYDCEEAENVDISLSSISDDSVLGPAIHPRLPRPLLLPRPCPAAAPGPPSGLTLANMLGRAETERDEVVSPDTPPTHHTSISSPDVTSRH